MLEEFQGIYIGGRIYVSYYLPTHESMCDYWLLTSSLCSLSYHLSILWLKILSILCVSKSYLLTLGLYLVV